MGTLPRDESPNIAAAVTINVNVNAAAPAPPAGTRASERTYKALLPHVQKLMGELRKQVEAGTAAEVDRCLLRLLQDWIDVSLAEIGSPKP
jgi:hypothetical protein